MIIISELGKKIQMLRKQRGYNQQVVAESFGVTRGTVSNWEKGRRIPSINTIEKIAKFYGVNVDFFVPSIQKNEVEDLLARANELFKSDSISEEDKNELHNQLMKIYINSKYG